MAAGPLSCAWIFEGRSDRIIRIYSTLRSTGTEVGPETLLKAPTTPFKLLVNVSAPAESGLSYEAESYRITRATAGRCVMVPTELGTLDDLAKSVKDEKPTDVHFSGHGKHGHLQFENEVGEGDDVGIGELVDRVRAAVPDRKRLPPFFYLASCYGNDPHAAEEQASIATGSMAALHDAGVTEVVGYQGPIVDELSTRAEDTLYDTIAGGESTRDAVRAARRALIPPLGANKAQHKPTRADGEAGPMPADAAIDTYPFAWAQLVLYRRGPEWPLSIRTAATQRRKSRVLERSFRQVGAGRLLGTGFIGRRTELHKVRRRHEEGAKVLVLQGLGELGKSTLAAYTLPLVTSNPEKDVCTL